MKSNYVFGILIFYVLISMLICMSGCKTCNCVTETVEVERETIIHHRDTTVVTEADSASMVALLHCDSNYNVVMEELAIVNGDRITLKSRLENKHDQTVLFVECNEDSLKTRIEWLEKENTELRKETGYREVEKKGFMWYSGLALWIMLSVVFLIVLVCIILKFVK